MFSVKVFAGDCLVEEVTGLFEGVAEIVASEWQDKGYRIRIQGGM